MLKISSQKSIRISNIIAVNGDCLIYPIGCFNSFYILSPFWSVKTIFLSFSPFSSVCSLVYLFSLSVYLKIHYFLQDIAMFFQYNAQTNSLHLLLLHCPKHLYPTASSIPCMICFLNLFHIALTIAHAVLVIAAS